LKDSNLIENKLIELVHNKNKRSKIRKVAKRFYILAKNCGKGGWKRCDIGSSYFIDLKNQEWDRLLIKHEIIVSE